MYRAGITYEQFGKLNMKKIRIISKAYSHKLEEDFKTADIVAFIQGRYMVDALLATVGNMFGGKNSKFSYPEQAYTMANKEQELTEDEIQRQREQFIATLTAMGNNFNLLKEKEEIQKQRG